MSECATNLSVGIAPGPVDGKPSPCPLPGGEGSRGKPSPLPLSQGERGSRGKPSPCPLPGGEGSRGKPSPCPLPPAPAPEVGEGSRGETSRLAARVAINIRQARHDEADLRFIDQLQKQYPDELGYWPRGQIEGYLKSGDVLIAESDSPLPSGEGAGVRACASKCDPLTVGRVRHGSPHPALSQGERVPERTPLGYIIGRDRYHKREDVGIIYQIAVRTTNQRGLIGAMLVQAMLAKAAYGCRLFCCWCAQDLPACEFWESLGFRPLAFRTGSERKKRIHIFWQKRLDGEEGRSSEAVMPEALTPTLSPRKGERGQERPLTPWWFPSNTTGGLIAEGRLVIPIPPGVHWRDAKPLVLPGAVEGKALAVEGKALAVVDRAAKRKSAAKRAERPALTPEQKRISEQGGLWFATPVVKTPGAGAGAEGEAKQGGESGAMVKASASDSSATTSTESGAAREGGRKERRVYDPKFVAAARELRDRYLEAVNAGRVELPSPAGGAKYDVRRNGLWFGEAAPTGGREAAIEGRAARRLLLQAA
jgi:hypothetical protein